jgi:hypothetical protein
MRFKIYRDCDQRLRLRKQVIELYDSAGNLVDRTRMFGAILWLRCFQDRRCERMLIRSGINQAAVRRYSQP